MFTSYGRLKYDPKFSKRFDPWWLLVECDDDLAAYYRRMTEKHRKAKMLSDRWLRAKGLPQQDKVWEVSVPYSPIMKPSWGNHISVVRGEEPFEKEHWKKYDGVEVEFQYDPQYINSNNVHWWMRVSCPRLEEIRLELGLTPQPTYLDSYTGEYKIHYMHFTYGKNREALPKDMRAKNKRGNYNVR